MKRHLLGCFAVACVTTQAMAANADPERPPIEPPVEREIEAQAQPTAEPKIEPQAGPPAEPPQPPYDRHAHLQARVALAGEYRGVYDLSVLGGGLVLSLGKDGDKSGQVNLRLAGGRTAGGLRVVDIGLGGSAEFVVTGGLLLGVGGGLALFSVERATSRPTTTTGVWLPEPGRDILTVGPELYGRIGYRFADRNAPFVTLDLGFELPNGGTFVWGPTLAVGYRF